MASNTTPVFVFLDESLQVAEQPPPIHDGAAATVVPLQKHEAAGSIFIRTGWKKRDGISGLAVVPPQSAATPRNRITLLTDDTPPPPAAYGNAATQGDGDGPNAEATSTTMASVVKNMDSLHGKFELLRPRVFMTDAQRMGGPPATVSIMLRSGTVPATVLDIDWNTQQVVIVTHEDQRPERKVVRLAVLLRFLDLPATGALAWDGFTPRRLTAPPEGVVFPYPPPPPADEPQPPGPVVDLTDTEQCSFISLRKYLNGLTSFGTDIDWTAASFTHVVDLMQAITTRMPLSAGDVLSMDEAGRMAWCKRATALLELKFNNTTLDQAANFTEDRTQRAQLLRSNDKSITPHKDTPPNPSQQHGRERTLPRDGLQPQAPPRGAPHALRDGDRAHKRRGSIDGLQFEDNVGAHNIDEDSDDSDDSDEEKEENFKRKGHKKKKTRDPEAKFYPRLALPRRHVGHHPRRIPHQERRGQRLGINGHPERPRGSPHPQVPSVGQGRVRRGRGRHLCRCAGHLERGIDAAGKARTRRGHPAHDQTNACTPPTNRHARPRATGRLGGHAPTRGAREPRRGRCACAQARR
jgi:hypothetical protein